MPWSSPAQEKEKEKRRPVQEKENKKRRGRELTGLGPRCVHPLKPTLVGEEAGRCCCCAFPISLDAAPWMARPSQEGDTRRELTLLDPKRAKRWEERIRSEERERRERERRKNGELIVLGGQER
jgi:hypothetical protein